MGKKVGTSFNTIQRLEKGESGISYRVVANIAKEFNLSLDYLIFGGDQDFGDTNLLNSIIYKMNHRKQFTEEESRYIDKLFFCRMTPIKDKKLLEELSLLLSEFNEENLQNILKFIRQLAKLTPEEQNILLKLFS
jgi:transcriptional regulator with XRE-family HTH domain